MTELEFCNTYSDMVKEYPALLKLFKEASKSKVPESAPIGFEIRTMMERKGKFWVPTSSETIEITVGQLMQTMQEMKKAKESGENITWTFCDTRFGSLPIRYNIHKADNALCYYTWDFVYKPARITYQTLCLKCHAVNSIAHRQEGTIGAYKIVCNEYDKYAVARIKNSHGDTDILTDWFTLVKCKKALEDLSTKSVKEKTISPQELFAEAIWTEWFAHDGILTKPEMMELLKRCNLKLKKGKTIEDIHLAFGRGLKDTFGNAILARKRIAEEIDKICIIARWDFAISRYNSGSTHR